MAVKDPRAGVGRGLHGITASNSNTRISTTRIPSRSASGTATPPLMNDQLGSNFERPRAAMVQRLQAQGITNAVVLAAMQAIPRHAFVDEALASRAYDDASLPIGHGQTISQPWVVARMIAAVSYTHLTLPTIYSV